MRPGTKTCSYCRDFPDSYAQERETHERRLRYGSARGRMFHFVWCAIEPGLLALVVGAIARFPAPRRRLPALIGQLRNSPLPRRNSH